MFSTSMSFLLFSGVSDGDSETIEPILLPVEESITFQRNFPGSE